VTPSGASECPANQSRIIMRSKQASSWGSWIDQLDHGEAAYHLDDGGTVAGPHGVSLGGAIAVAGNRRGLRQPKRISGDMT
jgi:hypothetical protein